LETNKKAGSILVVLFACWLWPKQSQAYGVLSHEAIIDAAWSSSIVPILRARYRPDDTELKTARAFAYGGCLIQDVGYYPFSSRFYGDLTHYVRGGDFIEALIREAHDVNELAFAFGALAHYAADNAGHRLAINPAVSLMYPKLAAKYGDHATYEDDPTAHIRTEFAFDVVQLASGSYLPEAYHDFIGFEISKPVLERAFRATYGLEIKDVFANFDLSLGTFRWTLGTAIPKMTKVAWDLKRKEIEELRPGVSRDEYLFLLPREEYEKEWGRTYRRPNFCDRALGFFVRILPKIGPLRALKFKAPTPEAEQLFLSSFKASVERYRSLLGEVRAHREPRFDNRNLDTGSPVNAGDYRLADEAYAELLARLAKDNFAGLTSALKAELLAFFADDAAGPGDRAEKKAWQEREANLQALRTTVLSN
jgi:hypothetical protein